MLVNPVIQSLRVVKPYVLFRAAPSKKQQCSDCFEKSGDKKIEKGNLIDGLEKSGFNKKDAAFLISLTMGALIAKFGIDYAKEAIMNKTFLVVDEAQKSVKSNDFQIDGDDGIFKISGTPINLDRKDLQKLTSKTAFWQMKKREFCTICANKKSSTKRREFSLTLQKI